MQNAMPRVLNLPQMANEGPTTLGATLLASVRKYADKPAMLIHDGSAYKPLSYRELGLKVRGFCAVLLEAGLAKGDRLAIQAENSPEWAMLDWACQCLGVVLVPIYPTLTAEQSQYIVVDSGAKLVVPGSPELASKTQFSGAPRSLLLRGQPNSLAAAASLDSMPEDEWARAISDLKPDDLATIIYTSGTTGNPKGVMLEHRSPVFLNDRVTKTLPVDSQDTFFSFLPLSHVFERYAGHWLPISCGATIAYSRGISTLAQDISAAKPTVVLCVPRFLEAMQDRITDSAQKGSAIKRGLFNLALSQGRRWAKGRFAPLRPLLDKVVGAKVRDRMGGRLRFFVSGGAALAPHTFEFYRGLGITILQGYGLTETCAATCLNPPDDNLYQTVGKPIDGVEVRIAEDGEILVRGPSVMRGYHNLPDDTASAIDPEGWFHTGDIGSFEGSHVRITDRKKDLLILANGKNVAPQPIENKLKESRLVSEAVLFGDGNEYVYGLIIPNFDHLRADLRLPDSTTPDEIVAREDVVALIKGEVEVVNRQLAEFEKVRRHAILSVALSVDTGELTPSMKVRRKVVKEKYAAVLASLERN